MPTWWTTAKPTKAPDNGEYYGEYGYYDIDGDGDYDEDDFFYHQYFDEVSTTATPDEFYDILESANYPDYFDSFDKIIKNRKSDESDKPSFATSGRHSENAQYLNSSEQKCERWPVQKCTIEQRFVTKYSPETSCGQVSRKLCAPKKCKESKVKAYLENISTNVNAVDVLLLLYIFSVSGLRDSGQGCDRE